MNTKKFVYFYDNGSFCKTPYIKYQGNIISWFVEELSLYIQRYIVLTKTKLTLLSELSNMKIFIIANPNFFQKYFPTQQNIELFIKNIDFPIEICFTEDVINDSLYILMTDSLIDNLSAPSVLKLYTEFISDEYKLPLRTIKTTFPYLTIIECISERDTLYQGYIKINLI